MLLARFDPEARRTQSLSDHLISVEAIARSTAATLDLGETAALAGMLHDMGKASALFQRYLLESGARCNHSSCGAQYLDRTFERKDPIDVWLQYLVGAAICGHHSGLPDYTSPQGDSTYKKRIYPNTDIEYDKTVSSFLAECISRDAIALGYKKARAEIQAHIEKLFQVNKSFAKNKEESFLFFLSLTARFLHAVVVDADRYDSYCWYVQKKPIMEPKIPPWKEGLADLEARLQTFSTDTMLNQVRNQISDSCAHFSGNPPGIYQLNVPTGSGKTLSVLRYALRLSEKTGYRHIFYIAPYRSIIEQNASEIRAVLPSSLSLLEHHSNVILEEDTTDDAIKNYLLATERWTDSDLIFTTLVQFLHTLFHKKSSAARRLPALVNSVIILDEVQSLPVKFIAMFNSALNYLSAVCGCSIVLCTATQPKLSTVPIPVWLADFPNMVDDALRTSSVFSRTRLVDYSMRPKMNGEEIAAFCLEQYQQGNSVLAIMNTKTAAKNIAYALKQQADPIPICFITTSLCAAHRDAIFQTMRAALSAGEKLICISTQLIEAGVDISFDCVIRSLAGLDSIAQAAGRCNRHGDSKALQPVYIIRSADENLSRLQDIRLAQEAILPVLEQYQAHPEQFDCSLLSTAAIDCYYDHYYVMREHEQLYPVPRGAAPSIYQETTVYDLLSLNRSAAQALAEKDQELPQKGLMDQAIGTASGLVQIIESQGQDVLVPYGNGGEIITALCGIPALDKQYKLQRKSQRYMVSLFDHELQILQEQGGIFPAGESGIICLNQRFYHPDLGVVLEPLEQDMLIM